MRKPKSPPKPNHYQASWLHRIAQSALMKTYVDGEERYSLQNGAAVPSPTAQTLIKNGWVKADRDGMFDDTQCWRALTP